MRGHLDVSTVLVARRDPVREGTTTIMSLFSWTQPFSGRLWVMLILLIIISGVVDWLLERNHMPGHKITSSLYEYSAGVLCMLHGDQIVDQTWIPAPGANRCS